MASARKVGETTELTHVISIGAEKREEKKIPAQMHLKLADVKEVHLCHIAIIFVSIVLSDICKKRNRYKTWSSVLLRLDSGALQTHVGEELGHLVGIALLAGCEDLDQTF